MPETPEPQMVDPVVLTLLNIVSDLLTRVQALEEAK